MDDLFEKRFQDFLVIGKQLPETRYIPDSPPQAAIDAVLEGGVDSRHLATAQFKLLVFAGVDGSGVTPALNCTLAGAKVGDIVLGIVDPATPGGASSKFETTITVDDEIQQTSLTDLSAVSFIVLVVGRNP